MDRFIFRGELEDGATVYGASHEIYNEVLITFPVGYWKGDGHPDWVELKFDTLTWAEYKEDE